MAAHALTGLIQVTHELTFAKEIPSHYSAIFDISCWSEDIDYDLWGDAYRAFKDGDLDGLFTAFVKAIPGVVKEWLEFGRPRTREQWMRVKYYGGKE